MESNDKDLTVRILARATELIKKEGAWIKDDFFAYDHETGKMDTNAYCALGAVYRAASEVTGHTLQDEQEVALSTQPWYPATNPAIQRLAKVIDPDVPVTNSRETVFTYNDEEAEYEDIVNVFCTALKEELNDGTPSE